MTDIVAMAAVRESEDGPETLYVADDDGRRICMLERPGVGGQTAGSWHVLPPRPPVVPVKSPEEQGYLHVDGAHLSGLSTWLGYVEQRIETVGAAGPDERARLLKTICDEAATARENLAAIRKGAKTT